MAADLLGSLSLSGVAGYVFLRWLNLSQFSVRHVSGEHVVFSSVIAGIVFVVLGQSIPTPNLADSSFLRIHWTSLLTIASAAMGAQALNTASNAASRFGFALPWFAPSRMEADKKAAIQADPFVRILDDANKSEEVLELTLRDRKTYIGFVAEIELRRSGTDPGVVSLVVPVLSGYRTGDTQQLEITTGYASLLRDAENWNRLKIAIPRSEITRARLFDLRLHVEGGFVPLSRPGQ